MGGTTTGHLLLRQLVRPGALAFSRNRSRLQSVQREKLGRILGKVAASPMGQRQGITGNWSWEDFAARQPVTRYSDWAKPVQAQMEEQANGLIQSPVMRYQPTSGSSSAIKWIPYTKQFLNELDQAISPWLYDLYQRYPGVRTGVHYWSLSWLPSDMRKQVSGHINDDMKLLSFGKRWLAGQTQAVPESVSLAASSDDSLFATLACLLARRDLSAMSVWSPTFALGLLEKLSEWREPLQEVLERGDWAHRGASLGHMKAPKNLQAAKMLSEWNGQPASEFYRALWPKLALISAWDTAAAAPWARRLRAYLPQSDFQGKGLWATEGVITIPQGEDHVLAVNSHAYEFEDAVSGEILPPWMIERGQEVIPLMTTGAGLLRYRLGDRLRVTGFQGELPCLEFLGRADSVDMVGEKISTVSVQQLLDSMSWPAGVSPVVVLGSQDGGVSGHPVYTLLAEAPANSTATDCEEHSLKLGRQLEEGLKENFHYQLARSLGQLDAAQCICRAGIQEVYLGHCRDRGMIEGNIKVEALRAWSGSLPGLPDKRAHSKLAEESAQ